MITIHLDTEGEGAATAVEWITAFYPDVVVEVLDGQAVRFSSPSRAESELRLIWWAGLANERLVSVRRPDRAALIATLAL
jgi:hypothetical protein